MTRRPAGSALSSPAAASDVYKGQARLGAVARSLIAQGRLLRLTSPDDLVLERRPRGATPPLRDPDHLVDLILEPAATFSSHL